MDAATLHHIVPSASLHRCQALIGGYNQCARMVGATTVRRAAMLIAMVAEESASLHATEEYGSGAEYNWRRDLGNVHPGDGQRFKGRTLIQITGRHNYGGVSKWAHKHWPNVPTSTYFLDHPAKLAELQYAWLGPTQYWLHPHNHGYNSINAAADHNDIIAATYMVNGGLNGLDTRRYYYHRAVAQGHRILPSHPAPTHAAPKPHRPEETSTMVIVYVSKSSCQKAGKRWPGYFLDTGAALHHIPTKAALDARRKEGIRMRTLSYSAYRAIGGK